MYSKIQLSKFQFATQILEFLKVKKCHSNQILRHTEQVIITDRIY